MLVRHASPAWLPAGGEVNISFPTYSADLPLYATILRTVIYTLAFLLVLAAPVAAQTAADSAAVLATLDSYERGWIEVDPALTVEAYADDVDWTNAFGDRLQGKDALRDYIEFLFGLDFVMAGESGHQEFADLMFLGPDVALIRSKTVRTGQQTSTGEAMPDRHVHALRVLHRRDGDWVIVSHLISQAHEKR